MKVYSIPEAMEFLKEEYGANNMPTSQETLRRAIRTKDLAVQEEGDPGRKGYTIAESDLRNYAESRLARLKKRISSSAMPAGRIIVDAQKEIIHNSNDAACIQFHKLYEQYLEGKLDEQAYSLALYKEKAKWEEQLLIRKEKLIELESAVETLKNEILGCETNISDYKNGISKLVF